MDRPPVDPPRLAEALLGLCLPPGDVREGVLGDLHELFLRRASGGAHRARAARRWYWAKAAGVGLSFALSRLRGRGQRVSFDASVGRWAGRWAGMSAGGPLGGAFGEPARSFRLGVRELVRHPEYALPAVLVLAVGMTAATTVFSLVDSIVLEPIDLPDAHRVVVVCEEHQRLAGVCVASPANVGDLRAGASTLADLGIGRGWPFTIADPTGTTGVRGGLASAGFLRALGATPAIGRSFRDDEIGAGRDRVVLLDHGYWVSRYGADAAVVGTTIILDGAPHEIVGILPEEFEAPFLDGIEMWKPPHVDPSDPETRDWRGFRAVGRLAEGASLAAASAELSAIYEGIGERHVEVDGAWRLGVHPVTTVVVGDTRLVLLAFLAGAGILLLIVCANTASLLLARGLTRLDELAVRTALGGSRRRLVGEIFLESLCLAVAATLLAVVLSVGALELVVRWAPPDMPRIDEVALGVRQVGVAAVLSVAVTAIFALVPAMRVTSAGAARASHHRTTEGPGRLQGALVVVEIMLCVVLLSSAAVLTRTFVEHLRWEPGFDYEPLVAVSAFVDVQRYPSREELGDFYRTAEGRLAAIPGVVRAATASAGPLFGGGDGATWFTLDDEPARPPSPDARTDRSVRWYDVGPGYFETMGLPIVAGRDFREDDGPSGPYVAIVNEAMTRLAGIEGAAVGRTVHLGIDLSVEIIGVAKDVVPLTPGTPTYPEIYWSNRQLPRPATFFVLRGGADPSVVAGEVRDVLRSIDGSISLGTPTTLTDAFRRATVRPRFQASVLLALAVTALLLGAVGVYGVVSHAVRARTREVGIRMALGARAPDIVGVLARSSFTGVALGVVGGVAGAFAVAPAIRGLVHGVRPVDPPSLVVAASVVMMCAAIATAVPLRRALRLDPRGAIRDD